MRGWSAGNCRAGNCDSRRKLRMPRRKALIAGATGVVGRNLLRHLLKTGEWEIVALSRRKPDVEGAYTHIGVDLMDAAECKAKLGHLGDVTHVFFAALAASR